MELKNSFQTGVADETTLTTANSDDNGAGDAFDIVTIGAGNGLVYDTAQPLVSGATLAARVDLGNASGTVVAAGWNLPGDETEIWGRLYFRLSDPMVDDFRIIGFEDNGLGMGRIVISDFTGGVVQVVNADFSQSAFAPGVIPQDTNMRLEYRLVANPTTGLITAKLFIGDSLTPMTDGEVTLSNTNTGSAVDRVTHGSNAAWAGTAYSFHMSHALVNDTGFPGPATAPSPIWLPPSARKSATVQKHRRM